jgi:anionic cell wall polymer biosynthesis LytR-Cps2A-Psr (LCP) family protein
MVDFTAFKQAIDAVGGVDINVTTQLYDPNVAWENKNNPLIAAVGQQHFDGIKALLYARSREGSARGDFDRTQRQRDLMAALKTKVLTLGTFANPLKLNQLVNAFGDHVSTDFSLNEMMRVYDIVKGVDASKIQSVGLADPPNNFVTTGTVNNQSVVLPRAGQFVYTDIQSYVRNTLRDPYLKSENANIVILNGTQTPGLATIKSTELKSYGYNVTLVADAPTNTYTKTVLIDMTKGVKKYTKNYLEKRLNVKALTTLPDSSIVPGTADFVIILGSNESAASN